MAEFRVVVVESNPADTYLLVEALRQAGLTDGVTIIEDSEHAIQYLQSQGAPDLVILDLNLVPLSGFELLLHIRSSPSLKAIPVVIMSGSENGRDVRKAYELGANCYISKPATLDRLLNSVKILYDFWNEVVTRPPKDPPPLNPRTAS